QGFQSTGARQTPDVSFNSDPYTGHLVYNRGAWYQVGGTSAAAPQWAGIVALADQGRAARGQGSLDGSTQTLYALYKMASTPYSAYYHDVTTGNNGLSAGPGYDQVTGLGTPRADQVVTGLVSVSGSKTSVTVSPPSLSSSSVKSA